MRVRCWGTRGSVPSPGPDTARYGGNTPCIEVRTPAGNLVILDAGSGLRPLGDSLAHGAVVTADLFLTHFHWDHIQGFPFFAPLYDASTTLRVHGAPPHGLDLAGLLREQMSPTFFPVPFDALAARISFHRIDRGVRSIADVDVSCFPLRHPGATLGFRVRAGDATLAYLPDSELVGGDYPVEPGWRAALVDFVRGADVLFHDAMYTEAEYPQREGWGHSTPAQAVALAEEAGVARLFLYHHAPARSDRQLDELVTRKRAELRRRGSMLQLFAAREGEALTVMPRSGLRPDDRSF